MLIYHFDPVTGLFLGSSTPLPDPLELEIAQTKVLATASAAAHAAFAAALENGASLAVARQALEQAMAAAQQDAEAVQPTVWLVPAHATEDAPPEPAADQIIRWVQGAWAIEAAPDPEVEPELPEATEEEIAAQVRAERNRRIAEVRYLVDRHRDELTLQRTTTLTHEDFVLVLQFIQDLRDVPEQDLFPSQIDWPDLPPEILSTGA